MYNREILSMAKNETIKENDIMAALSFGENYSTFKLVLMWICIAICIIGSIAMMVVSHTENNYDDFIASFIPIALLIVPIAFLACGYSRRKKIKLWLEDAVLLNARCECVHDFLGNGGEKILIAFVYDNEHLTRMSKFRYLHSSSFTLNGYFNPYNKLIGRDIKIFYSPKYDEVMIPKQ